MNRTIRVFIGDNPQLVGLLRCNAQGTRENASFEYDQAWLAASNRFALEPGLPLVAGPQFHRRSHDRSTRKS
jgi:serine/threonine-protein kinase HipA